MCNRCMIEIQEVMTFPKSHHSLSNISNWFYSADPRDYTRLDLWTVGPTNLDSDTIFSWPKNRCNGTHLILQRQVNLKTNHYDNVRKQNINKSPILWNNAEIHNQLKYNLKIW